MVEQVTLYRVPTTPADADRADAARRGAFVVAATIVVVVTFGAFWVQAL